MAKMHGIHEAAGEGSAAIPTAPACNPDSSALHTLMAGYSGPTPGEVDVPPGSIGKELW